MACNSKVNRQLWPEFEFVREFKAVLVICKFDDDQIENEGAIVSTTCSTLRASNSKASSPIWSEIEIEIY